MFEILVTIAFIWLFIKVIGLTFKVTWGLAKIVAVILFALALPTLIGCLLLAGGVASSTLLREMLEKRAKKRRLNWKNTKTYRLYGWKKIISVLIHTAHLHVM